MPKRYLFNLNLVSDLHNVSKVSGYVNYNIGMEPEVRKWRKKYKKAKKNRRFGRFCCLLEKMSGESGIRA